MRALGAAFLLAAAYATGNFGYAQAPAKVARIGALGTAPSPAWESFRAGMRDLGWIEGRNLLIEWRYAKGRSELHVDHAAEFSRMKLDVIVAPLSLQVEAARKATRTIPIVFCCHTDPVGQGHAQSVARPGGNTTGVALFTADVTQKRLEILKKLLPNIAHAGILRNPDYLEHRPELAALQQAGPQLGIRLTVADARQPEEFENAYEALRRAGVSAVIVLLTTSTYVNRAQLAELERKYRLPSAHASGEHARVGALMSFGVDTDYVMRRTASFVDRILKGARPGDLPIEQATKYEFVLNLGTAKALGVTVPASVMISATEIIQ